MTDKRPPDIEAIDYDEMRRQINATHQGPWFRVPVSSMIGLDLSCDAYAVHVDDCARVTAAVALGCAGEVVAVLDVGCLPGHPLTRFYQAVENQIEKQKQCRADCRRVGCGCQC